MNFLIYFPLSRAAGPAPGQAGPNRVCLNGDGSLWGYQFYLVGLTFTPNRAYLVRWRTRLFVTETLPPLPPA